ncbi:hypothetical protein RJP21_26715 [Paenibacillus sp. VCA1]|uniref:hypothetical protein n=1 Tax=Paenibacillus sp. VCA1 TaxID=3039148 RepID=UPI0028711A77|nr:hypothetical protein [Paenibacillus sp. VCA1]MDR9857195.1 hypothetical protein [Paenibacillus sp. VCA1]
MGEAIRFSQRNEPHLKTGTYRIQVETVTNIDCQLASEAVDITVSTERFRLPPDQIYSVYPPREAVGDYTECLPHIVLNRRSLPWEKTLLNSNSNMPWLALLVFDETEGIQMVESTCEEALKPEPGIFVPSIVLAVYEKPEDPCTCVHIPVDLLADILPYAEALSLLAHGKGVSLDHKVTDASVKDDWFAAVVANRFCLEPEGDRHAIRHTACLVSLEGYEACLGDEQNRREALAHCHSARMIVLANWSFSMAKAAFDFASSMASLDAAMISTPYQGNNEQVQQLCRLGYFPMNHHVRDGSQTVSWYQPPLVPYDESKEKTRCVRFADQLLEYDPDIGMMDIRYSSAWQIGKSMALADQSFVQKLYAWRQSNEMLARTSVYHGLLEMHLSSQHADESIRHRQDDHSMGHRFVQAARKYDEMDHQNSGKQTVLRQLNDRYRSLLSEVKADASTE